MKLLLVVAVDNGGNLSQLLHLSHIVFSIPKKSGRSPHNHHKRCLATMSVFQRGARARLGPASKAPGTPGGGSNARVTRANRLVKKWPGKMSFSFFFYLVHAVIKSFFRKFCCFCRCLSLLRMPSVVVTATAFYRKLLSVYYLFKLPRTYACHLNGSLRRLKVFFFFQVVHPFGFLPSFRLVKGR